MGLTLSPHLNKYSNQQMFPKQLFPRPRERLFLVPFATGKLFICADSRRRISLCVLQRVQPTRVIESPSDGSPSRTMRRIEEPAAGAP